MKIIGLTGSIATGKSTVARMLQEANIPVVDADRVARLVVEKGSPTLRAIAKEFGDDVLTSSGALDRDRLGSIIFQDEERRQALNRIIHPAIREEMERQKQQHLAQGEPIVVMDIPLLFENQLQSTVDEIVVVAVDEATQLARLMERNHLTEEEAASRIASQLPIREKEEQATVVIDNSGTMEQTREAVQALITRWRTG